MATHVYKIKKKFLLKLKYVWLTRDYFKKILKKTFIYLIFAVLVTNDVRFGLVPLILFFPEYYYVILIFKDIYLMSIKSDRYEVIELSKTKDKSIILNWLTICKYRAFLKLYLILTPKEFNFKYAIITLLLVLATVTFSIPLKLIRTSSSFVDRWEISIGKTISNVKYDEYCKIEGKAIISYFGKIMIG